MKAESCNQSAVICRKFKKRSVLAMKQRKSAKKQECQDLLRQLQCTVPALSQAKLQPTESDVIFSAVKHIQELEMRILNHPAAPFMLMKMRTLQQNIYRMQQQCTTTPVTILKTNSISNSTPASHGKCPVVPMDCQNTCSTGN